MNATVKSIDALNEIRLTIEIFRMLRAGDTTYTVTDVAAQFDRTEEMIDSVAIPTRVCAISGKVMMNRNQRTLAEWRMGAWAELREQFEEDYAA